MAKTGKRFMSLLMAAVLLIGLIVPANTAHAAISLVITKPLASSTSSGNPVNVTSKMIDIEFQYTDISDADLTKLYYRVTNLTTGAVTEVKDNPVQKLGTGQGVFRNVELSEGLNQIVIVLDIGSRPESLPVWINFTEVVSITNLTIDNRTFTNGIFVPLGNASSTGLIFIEGFAPNANDVMGYTTLRPEGDRSDFLVPQTGQFSFSAGHDALAELPLRAGDNDLTIVASNAFKTYRADRQFVYNDGGAFLYNTVVAAVYNLKPADEPYLFRQPTLEGNNSSGPFGISVKTDIKINKTGGTLAHDRIELQVNSLTPIEAMIGAPAGGSVTVNIPSNSPANQTKTYAVEDRSEYYLIKNVVFENVGLDINSSRQVLNVTFENTSTNAEETQTFSFSFINENLPYVKEVRIAGGQPLYSGIEINILTSSFQFEIDTTDGVEAVNLYLVDGSTETLVATSGTYTDQTVNGAVNRTFTMLLNKELLPEGRSTLRFVPVIDANAGTEILLGAKEFLINYNPSPYVYVTNVTNGQAYMDTNSPNAIDRNGNEAPGPVFQIRPVNIPQSQFTHILVRWNENADWITTTNNYAHPNYTDNVLMRGDAAYVNDNGNPGDFIEFRFRFGPNTPRPNWSWVEGLNTLVIEVYDVGARDGNGNLRPGAVPITTMKYELFYFTESLPNIGKLDLTDALKQSGKYQTMSGTTQRYYTQESSMEFTAQFTEANTVEITVRTLDKDGDPVVRTVLYRKNNANNGFEVVSGDATLIREARVTSVNSSGNVNGTITSNAVNLYGSGTNTVEITVMNKAGNLVVSTLEIVREPATFNMHYPAIDQNPVTKAWEGRVNGNYTRVILEAEGATKIIYNKKEEVDKTTRMRIGGVDRDVFVFELKGLKAGTNRVSFTIVRGTRNDEVTINLINADTPVPGAEFKESISKTNIKAFGGQLQLKLEKGTILMRNNTSAADRYLSPTRELLIAIADPNDGRVNKYLHPAFNETSPFEKKQDWQSNFARIQNINSRFRKASPLFWIDGGYIPLSGDVSQQDILYGSGIYPYEYGQEFYLRNAQNRNDQFVLSKPGQLTLSYDPNMVQSSWRYVTVFHYGYNENHLGQQLFEWKNIGGVVDPKKNTITVPIQEMGYYVVMYMDQSFDDIIGHSWARDFLDTLYSKGIMKNKETLRFETNEPITRGEFVSLIVKALNLPLNYEGTGTFTDVTRVNPLSFGLYEYKYIETAARAGIARGMLQGRFQPNNPITREDAASLIARALNLNLSSADTRVLANLEKQFTDANDINTYARAAVDAVVKKKLMEGKPSVTSNPGDKPTYYFDPKANLTRAEASVIIMKMLLDQKRIPSL